MQQGARRSAHHALQTCTHVMPLLHAARRLPGARLPARLLRSAGFATAGLLDGTRLPAASLLRRGLATARFLRHAGLAATPLGAGLARTALRARLASSRLL